jgi:hypothetical protein
MDLFPMSLDILALVAALFAAIFWWMASSRDVRRVSHLEELDAADINRLVVAINRNQMLNRRGAMAAAASALFAAARIGSSLLAG